MAYDKGTKDPSWDRGYDNVARSMSSSNVYVRLTEDSKEEYQNHKFRGAREGISPRLSPAKYCNNKT